MIGDSDFALDCPQRYWLGVIAGRRASRGIAATKRFPPNALRKFFERLLHRFRCITCHPNIHLGQLRQLGHVVIINSLCVLGSDLDRLLDGPHAN